SHLGVERRRGQQRQEQARDHDSIMIAAGHKRPRCYPGPMEVRFFRIAYAIQFVLTWMAAFEVWAQVGGQGHLDLMPWYSKLLFTGALALAAVKATVAAVERDKLWNKRTSAWLAAALALIAGMGIPTYYQHLHEPTDEDEEPPARLNLS